MTSLSMTARLNGPYSRVVWTGAREQNEVKYRRRISRPVYNAGQSWEACAASSMSTVASRYSTAQLHASQKRNTFGFLQLQHTRADFSNNFCQKVSNQNAFIFGSRPSDHYFHSVCWFVCLSVCLFVQSFSQPFLIRFRSNLDICYTSGSSCVP